MLLAVKHSRNASRERNVEMTGLDIQFYPFGAFLS